MRYFVHSVKFFCAACVLALLSIAAMVATGTAAASWNDWHRFAVLFGFLALFAALYPKLTFVDGSFRATSPKTANSARLTRSAKPDTNLPGRGRTE